MTHSTLSDTKNIPSGTRRVWTALWLGLLLFFPACASNKAGLTSPELPARHWLEEAPGVPVENKDKLEAAVTNLYDPNKIFSFEDCVYLTIQQSPLLVNSAVNLEIKRVDLTSHMAVSAGTTHVIQGFQQHDAVQQQYSGYAG